VDYFFFVGTIICIWALVSLAVNLVLGYTGLFSIGHVGYLAIGAYTSASLNILLGVPFLLTLPIAVGVTALVAWLTLLPLLRLAPFHFGLATLGLNVVLADLLRNLGPRTRGAEGLYGLQVPDLLASAPGRFVLVLVLTAACVLGVQVLTSSPFGRVLRALRDRPEALQSLGKDPRHFQVVAWTISGAIAGLAGALYATTLFYIDPTVFLVTFSFNVLVYVGVGGLASIAGSLLGPLLLIAFSESLRFTGLPSDVSGPVQQALFGLLLIVLMLFRRRGLVGTYELRD
jgi:ABC-type branched-subunit amino acid transport system permease subunit